MKENQNYFARLFGYGAFQHAKAQEQTLDLVVDSILRPADKALTPLAFYCRVSRDVYVLDLQSMHPNLKVRSCQVLHALQNRSAAVKGAIAALAEKGGSR